MSVVINSKFCESSTDSVPLNVCAKHFVSYYDLILFCKCTTLLFDPFCVDQNVTNAHLEKINWLKLEGVCMYYCILQCHKRRDLVCNNKLL